MITNDDEDFKVTGAGFSVAPSVGLMVSRSYALDDGNKGALYCTSGAVNLDTVAGIDLQLTANGVGADLRLFAEEDLELLMDRLSFFGETPSSKQSIDEYNPNAAVTELQNILIAYGLATDNR